VRFIVACDGQERFRSRPLESDVDGRVPIEIDVSGVDELRLLVPDEGTGHANWCDLRLWRVGAEAPCGRQTASLCRGSERFPVPATWRIPKVGRRDFWYRGQSDFQPRIVSRDTWEVEDVDRRWWFLVRGGSADAYGMSETKYGGPFGRLSEAPKLKGAVREKALNSFKRLIVEDFVPRQIPFYLAGYRQKPTERVWPHMSKEDWRRWVLEVDELSQGLFLGVWMKEWDGTWLARRKRGVGPFTMESDFGTRRDFWRLLNHKLLPYEMHIRSVVPGVPVSHMSGSFPIMNYWCYELGRRMCFTEARCGQSGFADLPFMRGAGRQYGHPWGWFRGFRYGLWTHFLKLHENEAISSLLWHRADQGFSRQHLSMYRCVPFMAGANMVIEEGFPRQFFADYDEDLTYTITNPLGEDVYRFHQFTQRHSDRGVPYTPVGVLMDWHSGWAKGRGLKFGVYPLEGGGFMEDTFWNVVFPYDAYSTLREETFHMPSPYGDVFDVLLPNPPSGAIAPETLAGYRVLIALGDLSIDKPLAQRLRAYIESGGTLVLNVMHLGDALNDSAFTGLAVTNQKATADAARGLLDDRRSEGAPFSYRVATSTAAEVIIENPRTRHPLVTRQRHGKGQVIVTLCEWMVEDGGTKIRFIGSDGRYVPRREAVRFWPHLMEMLTADLLPIRITGERLNEQLWYSVNRRNNAWLVTLVNQGGFCKRIEGLPEIDLDRKLQLRIEYAGRPLAVREWTLLGDRDLELSSATADRVTIDVGLEPGEFKVVEIRTSDEPNRVPSRMPPNLALGKTASASSFMSPSEAARKKWGMRGAMREHRPEEGVDGRTGRLNGWFSQPGFPQWYEVDLADEHEIGRAVIKTFYSTNPHWRVFYRYYVELSSDRETWTKAVDFTQNIDDAPEIGYMHWMGGKKTRYVRVTFTGCSARHDASVREIEVYPYDPKW